MTFIQIEGFEVFGDTTQTAANVATALTRWSNTTISKTSGLGNPSIVDDFEAVGGLALRFPACGVGQFYRVTTEFPAAFKITTNSSVPVFVLSARIHVPVTTAGTELIQFVHANNTGMIIGVQSDGTTLTYNYSGVTTGTAAGAWTADDWNYLEIEIKPTSSGNGGYLKVYVNNTLVVNVTGTVGNSSSATKGFQLRLSSAVTNTGDNWVGYDDIVIYTLDGATHTSVLGPLRVARLVPNADATPLDWATSGGVDHFSLVDEANYDVADYVETATDTEEDYYDLSALPASTAVHCVQVDVETIATSGTPTLHIGIDDGTQAEVSGGVIGTASAKKIRGMFTAKPSGGAWDESTVNSLKGTIRFQT